jgi:hypothetical protein
MPALTLRRRVATTSCFCGRIWSAATYWSSATSTAHPSPAGKVRQAIALTAWLHHQDLALADLRQDLLDA